MLAKAGRIGLVFLILATIACDRVSKHVAEAYLSGSPDRSYLSDTIRLGYAENTGGFLGFGAGLPVASRIVVFTLLTGLMLGAMTFYVFRRRETGWPMIGLAVFVAGGLSNWIDRLFRGSVVDFINMGIGPLRTGIFNVADVAILVGAAVFVAAEFRRPPGEPPVG
jgi:signal peptidase II